MDNELVNREDLSQHLLAQLSRQMFTCSRVRKR
jgi:hypothetical protein